RAMIGERALGNDFFDSWRGTLNGTPGDERRDWTRVITIPWVAHDHAFYLENMTDAIRRTGLSYPDALAQRADWERDRKLFPRLVMRSDDKCTQRYNRNNVTSMIHTRPVHAATRPRSGHSGQTHMTAAVANTATASV